MSKETDRAITFLLIAFLVLVFVQDGIRNSMRHDLRLLDARITNIEAAK
ncbi:MAG: hypothetical protein Q7S17_05760 [Xanthobacteraceae bacterium]|nr:hypothetical protein [Xanthobacteraceae bacterium]